MCRFAAAAATAAAFAASNSPNIYLDYIIFDWISLWKWIISHIHTVRCFHHTEEKRGKKRFNYNGTNIWQIHAQPYSISMRINISCNDCISRKIEQKPIEIKSWQSMHTTNKCWQTYIKYVSHGPPWLPLSMENEWAVGQIVVHSRPSFTICTGNWHRN